MKTDTDRTDERLWQFLHGEMDDAGRDDLERAMDADDGLKERCERARRLDGALRALLPKMGEPESDPERLAERACAAWEEDQRRAGLAVSARKPALARGLWAWRKALLGGAALAAAAALMAVVSPALRGPHGVSWEPPRFSPLVLRGSGVAPKVVDAAAAGRCRRALAEAVSRVAAERRVELPRGLAFSFQVQELREGALSVAVQAKSADGRLAGEWLGDYSSAEAFLKQAEASAARIVEALTSPPRDRSEGVRP